MTRTQNSLFNWLTGIGSTLLMVLLNFITRSVFIRNLGTDFLGIEGLFSNILSMLSLAELGFGSAIVFKLYKPIELNDRPRILVLLKLYREVYVVLGLVIAVIGLCLIPLLPVLIKDYESVAELGLNAVFIFLLYLFNSVSSYWFFGYKTTFVEATQKTYLLTIVGYGLSIANSLLQILVLVRYHDFVLYLIVQIAFSVLRNLVYAFICDKRYPYVKEKTSERISRSELKDFFKDCSALFLYRASNIVLSASDNLVLSSIVGLQSVGLYANYLSVKLSLRNLLYTFTSAMQASLGSIHSTGNLDWSRLIFRVVNFLTFWMYGIGAIGLAILSNDFITLWLGTNYVVTSWSFGSTTIVTPVALLIGIETYIIGQQFYCGSFRNAAGLFQQLKYRPIISMTVNLVICILTVPYLGIAGCVLSTIIAGLTTNLIIDPIIIHKKALKIPVRPYFFRNLLYKLVVVAAGLVCWQIYKLTPIDGILGFIVHGCICVIVPCCIFTLCFFRTEEFRFFLDTIKALLARFLPRKS